MLIGTDDISGVDVRDLLALHAAGMRGASPEDACHFLDLDALRAPDVTFWTTREHGTLAGCGALLELDPTHGEVKSMRTHPSYLRRGVGAALLEHIVATATERGYARLSLETGTGPDFEAAHTLYEHHGFTDCAPFATYAANDFSRFMTRPITGRP